MRDMQGTTLEIKEVTEAGVIKGYGSTFGNEDHAMDIMAPGSFSASLNKRPAKAVKMLFQHKWDMPCGIWDVMKEDGKGLYVEGHLMMKTKSGQEVYEYVKEGAIDGLSIGFRTLKEDFDRTTGVRTIKEVDLKEISVVTFPCNEQATITSIKGQMPTERELEEILMRDAGFSAKQAKAFISQGYKAVVAGERDATDEAAIAEIFKKFKF